MLKVRKNASPSNRVGVASQYEGFGMDKQILLINDMVEVGKLALSTMVPVLSYMGFPVSTLPTALVSNAFEYNKFNMLDTTSHMRESFKAWGELDFSFDAIATGFMMSEEQVDLINYFCSQYDREEHYILVDPTMGDDGHLYSGLGGEMPRFMRKLIAVASIAVPNYTEACMLTKTPYVTDPISQRDADGLVDKIRKLGALSVSITSCVVEGKGDCVVGYDYLLDQRFCLPFERIPVDFPGTGDLFSAVLLGRLLQDQMLESSTQSAMDAVYGMLDICKNQNDPLRGIPVEQLLEVIDE